VRSPLAKPSWIRKLPINLIRDMAARHSLDVNLLTAVVMTESGGDTTAIRHEPKWKYFYHPERYARDLQIRLEVELLHQAHSWGLMQVMGSVARELGHEGRLEELLKPQIGMHYGCKKLSQCLKREKGDFESALARYNGGSARRDEFGELEDRLQGYVDKVFGYYSELRNGVSYG
jgi:hypothetical protein